MQYTLKFISMAFLFENIIEQHNDTHVVSKNRDGLIRVFVYPVENIHNGVDIINGWPDRCGRGIGRS
jgi:hypothetical protein